MRVLAALATTVAVAAGGCTSGQEVPARTSPDDVVRQSGTLGTAVDYFGIDGTVFAIEPFDQSDDGFPRFRVTIRTRSHLDVPWENPDVAVRCDESPIPGDWHSGSTWEGNGIVPGGRTLEGQIILGFPPKEGAERYPVPTCTNGVVEVTGTDPLDRDRKIITSYPIAPEMIAAAIDAPRQ
jgi:hypothetical protein